MYLLTYDPGEAQITYLLLVGRPCEYFIMFFFCEIVICSSFFDLIKFIHKEQMARVADLLDGDLWTPTLHRIIMAL